MAYLTSDSLLLKYRKYYLYNYYLPSSKWRIAVVWIFTQRVVSTFDFEAIIYFVFSPRIYIVETKMFLLHQIMMWNFPINVLCFLILYKWRYADTVCKSFLPRLYRNGFFDLTLNRVEQYGRGCMRSNGVERNEGKSSLFVEYF